MSYVFEGQENAEDPNQKQNIFAPNPMDDQGMSQGQGDSLQKTSTETQVAGGGGQAGAAQKTSPVTTAQRQSAISSQARRQVAPKTLEALGGKLGKAQTDLQSEANSYVQNYQNKDYTGGINQDVVQRGIKDSNEDFNKIRDYLGKAKEEAEEFKPQTQTSNFGVEKLGSKSGIKDFYQEEFAAPQYSGAEAAYDAMLLAKSPNFQKTRAALEKQQRDLSLLTQKEQADRTLEANQLAQAGLQREQGNVRGMLSGQSDEIMSRLKAAEQAEDQRRAGLDQGQIARELEERQRQALALELEKEGGLSSRARAQLGGIDSNPFVTINRDTSYQDFANQEDATRFNNVMNLLQRGDYLSPTGGPKKDIELNDAGIRDALRQEAILERNKLEKGYLDEKQGLIDNLQRQASDINATRQRGSKYYADLTADDALNKNFYGNQDEIERARAQLNADEFYTAGDKIDWRNVLSRDQANRLNYLADETGYASEGSNAGSLGGGAYSPIEGAHKDDYFRKGAYENAILEVIQKIRSEDAARRAMESALQPQAVIGQVSQPSTVNINPSQGLQEAGGNIANVATGKKKIW